MNSPWLLRILLAAGVCLGTAAMPTLAQRATFQPSLELRQSYTSNALYAGPGGAEASDWITNGRVALPVGQQWRNKSWSLEYSLSHERYQDFSVLDHTDHLVRFDFGSEPSPRSSFSLGASFNKTQLQGNTASLESQDLFLVGRANSDVYGLDLAFRREQTPRWRWNVAASGNSYQYRRITAAAEVISPVPLEDRKDYEGFWGLSRVLTQATALGGEYRFRFFDLSVSGNESAHFVSVIVDHEMPHRLSVSCRLGVSLTTMETTSATASTVSLRRTGVQGSIGVRRSFRKTELTFLAEHSPSAGGALSGTSTNSWVGLTLSGNPSVRWRWDVAARYARRDPTAPLQPTLTNAGAAFSVEWRPLAKLGVRMLGEYADQLGGGAAALSSSYFTAGAALIWYPRGVARGVAEAG